MCSMPTFFASKSLQNPWVLEAFIKVSFDEIPKCPVTTQHDIHNFIILSFYQHLKTWNLGKHFYENIQKPIPNT